MSQTLHTADRALIAFVQQTVTARLQDQQAGHGMDHVLRVHANACHLQEQAGGDRLTIELAALLHDVGDAKFHAGIERSAEFSREILTERNVSPELVEHVASIVDGISFRKGLDPSQLSHEGRIVQDADRLDAIGAVGIVRTIEYGATQGQPFYVPSDAGTPVASGTGLAHFYDKLFKLSALLNTDAAKRMAAQREQFMHQFVKQFLEECQPVTQS